jgi:hypothetical protein
LFDIIVVTIMACPESKTTVKDAAKLAAFVILTTRSL